MRNSSIVPKIIAWVFYATIAATVFTVRWFVSGMANTLYGTYDCLFLAGIIVALLGALTLVAYFGAFDMFSYGFMSIFGHMRPNPAPMKYKDYPEYLEAKKQKRAMNKHYFLPYVVIGGSLLIAALIVYLIYRGQ